MRTEWWAILLAIGASLVGSCAALALKIAGNKPASFQFINGYSMGGVVLYVLAIFIFFLALKGGELTTLTPFDSLSYFWVAILSKMFLREKVEKRTVIGIALIFCGILIINLAG